MDTIAHLIRLPPTQRDEVAAALVDIPWEARTTSLRKWRKLLGLLRNITPAVNVSRGMFTQVQHALKRAAGRHVKITTDVHDKLEAWRELVCSLANRSTHLRKLEPFALSWIITTDASGSRMGGVFQYPEEQYFVWRYPFYQSTQARLVSSSNPKGDVKINDLELGALLIQILLFSPRMALLEHIHTYVDNKAVQGWANRASVSTAYSVRPILRGLSLAARRKHIHASVGRVLGEDNKMSNTALQLTHLLDRKFISHLRTHFP